MYFLNFPKFAKVCKKLDFTALSKSTIYLSISKEEYSISKYVDGYCTVFVRVKEANSLEKQVTFDITSLYILLKATALKNIPQVDLVIDEAGNIIPGIDDVLKLEPCSVIHPELFDLEQASSITTSEKLIAFLKQVKELNTFTYYYRGVLFTYNEFYTSLYIFKGLSCPTTDSGLYKLLEAALVAKISESASNFYIYLYDSKKILTASINLGSKKEPFIAQVYFPLHRQEVHSPEIMLLQHLYKIGHNDAYVEVAEYAKVLYLEEAKHEVRRLASRDNALHRRISKFAVTEKQYTLLKELDSQLYLIENLPILVQYDRVNKIQYNHSLAVVKKANVTTSTTD